MKNEKGGACSRYGRQKMFSWGDLRERVLLEDLGVDGKILL
jgi:hypothetical protein